MLLCIFKRPRRRNIRFSVWPTVFVVASTHLCEPLPRFGPPKDQASRYHDQSRFQGLGSLRVQGLAPKGSSVKVWAPKVQIRTSKGPSFKLWAPKGRSLAPQRSKFQGLAPQRSKSGPPKVQVSRFAKGPRFKFQGLGPPNGPRSGSQRSKFQGLGPQKDQVWASKCSSFKRWAAKGPTFKV